MNKLNLYIYNEILENRMVSFGNGQIYPSYGWAVVMLGGPGSGKGYFRKNKLPIEAKVIDVDELKQKFVKLGLDKEVLNGETYDSSNPKHVSAIHMAVKQHGWKNKILNMFFGDVKKNGQLDNILFDITGSDPEESVKDKILAIVKAMGYKTSIIWVITRREEAMLRNLQRSRSVSDNILHGIHQDLSIELPKFLQSADTAKYIDNLWLYFSSPTTIKKDRNTEEEDIKNLMRIPKIDGKYTFDANIKNKLKHYISAASQDDYISSSELKHKFGVVSFDKNGNPVTKFDRNKMSDSDLVADKS